MLSTPVIMAIGFLGTLVFLGLAVWVWQRGRTDSSLGVSWQSPPGNDEATQFIPPPTRNESTTRLAPPPPREKTGTVAVPAPTRAEGTVAIPASAQAAKARGIVPLAEEPTMAIPPPASKEGTAMFVHRPALTRPKPASAPTPTTEVISREEILAVIAKHKASDAVAAEVSGPAPAPIFQPPPASTEFVLPATVVGPKAAPILAPTPRRATAPSIAAELLQQHFDAALTAFTAMLASDGTDLLSLAQSHELEWRRNVDVLALVAERSVSDYVLPTLLDSLAEPERRSAAASVLLELEIAKGHERLLEHFDDLDAVGRESAIAAVIRWGNERADTIASKGYRAASTLDSKLLWLRVFAQRAADPGPIVEELLATSEPALLAAGLCLLPHCERGRELASKIDRHVVTGPPGVRMAAIRAGLVFERPSAWIVCRQGSRDPALPEACLLVGMLAPEAENDALAAWASKPSAPAHAGWALGVSGRFAGIAGCIARLDHDDPNVVAESLAGFQHATGYLGADTASAAEEWWKANESRFARDGRYVGGEPFSMGSIRTTIAKASRASRDAVRLELQIRSGGKLRLPANALPSRELAALTALDTTTIDLNRSWGK